MSKNPSLAIFPQEEELRKSGEAKYAHLSNDLHVLIEVFAPPGEAYSRMSHALEEIKKFLVPVSVLYLIFSSSFSSCAVYEQQSLLLTWSFPHITTKSLQYPGFVNIKVRYKHEVCLCITTTTLHALTYKWKIMYSAIKVQYGKNLQDTSNL